MLNKKIGWQFDNTYAKLPENMLSKVKPTQVQKPELIIFNHELAREIGLNFSNFKNKELAEIFSGNKLPIGSETIAQAYAGHQFGHFTILGDGRALIIGEHVTKDNHRYDIQFKGSGKTPYSRNADGRAALGPMLREYIISESMHKLGIKTSRSLAVVQTGENIIREKILKGAILTRVASSHIRIGTFQYALISKDKNDLKALFDYTVERHYPHIKESKSSATELLEIVLEKQINLICDWMRVGFIHGVMNTDNMTISGETIDYGPCAFMDRYDPATVFSSIDQLGRYAYFNQPRVAKWNLERFAESLLPLIDKDSDKAIEKATEILKEFSKKYKTSWIKMMKQKLGFKGEDQNDESLITDLLKWMHQYKADYTNTFCYLMNKLVKENKIFENQEFKLWKKKWEYRIKLNNNSYEESIKSMRKSNPFFIPRNHLVEDALNDAEANNFETLLNLLAVLKKPYDNNSLLAKFQTPSDPNNVEYKTYCGT